MKIGLITSGGDSPGMNAFIHEFVKLCSRDDYEVMGFIGGFRGIEENNYMKLRYGDLCRLSIAQRGGSFLQTGRYEELKDDARLAAFKLRIDSIGLDRLVVLGGDGSFRCALKLSKLGLGTICVPATIDNNIPGTDYTLGFDTAINKTLKNINDIGDTGSSMPGKVYIIETLGGDSGNIAEAAYNCGAADIAIAPEDNRCDDEVIDMVEEVFRSGKQYVIISIGEGVGKTMYYSKLISERLGRKVHETIIGHQQRGGSPTAFDRMMAAEFALQAKKIIDEGLPLNMVAYRKGNTIGQDYGIFLK